MITLCRHHRGICSGAALALILGATGIARGDVLWDNGDPDGEGGHSNAAEGVFGSRRTVLDDFEIPGGESWRITGLHHFHVWNTMPPGSGTGMELAIWSDRDGEPWKPVLTLNVSAYQEMGTGRTFFGRPEAESFTEFEPVELPDGRWWFEGTVVGPENNFWLTTGPVRGSEHWVNYDDLGGLQPSTTLFGVATDLNFQIHGVVACTGDIDGNGAIDFTDLLALLAAWGTCESEIGCPEDLNDDHVIDFEDVLMLLASWGACEQAPVPR